jgi:hypothetical protein
MIRRTPPRFRALIWSMVWSLLLDADCVNPLDPATGFCASLRHLEVVRDGIEANVRCAMRGTDVLSRARVAPAASLHGADMVGMCVVRVAVRCESTVDFFQRFEM